jgi:hypothetical protein
MSKLTKNQKIIMWSSITLGSILAIWGISKLFSKPTTQSPQTSSNDTIASGLEGAVKKETNGGDTTSTIPPTESIIKVANPSGTCGIRRTDYDRDFDYIKCNGVWYTISKPNSSRGVVYGDWLSLASNALATQRLNSRYPNG